MRIRGERIMTRSCQNNKPYVGDHFPVACSIKIRLFVFLSFFLILTLPEAIPAADTGVIKDKTLFMEKSL
jgi:hypothetical protein